MEGHPATGVAFVRTLGTLISDPVMTLCSGTRTRRQSSLMGAAVSASSRESFPVIIKRSLLAGSFVTPRMQIQRGLRAPLRRMDFLDGFAVYRDNRRKAEVYIDPSLLPIGWDPTWNQWKHLVGTKIGISGAFVNSGKYRLRKNQWRLAEWQTALPSRLSVTMPTDALEQINTARRLHQRLGEHYDAIAAIRDRLEREPLEYRDLADICRKLRLPSDFDVSLLCWQPDYDRFFFDQLKKRSVKIFLFRSEYIFDRLARDFPGIVFTYSQVKGIPGVDCLAADGRRA